MRVDGAIHVDLPIDRVWEVITDPSQLCPVMPGCEEAHQIDATHYAATFGTKVQFMTIRANATGEVLEWQEPHRLVVDGVGETLSFAGAFRARMTVELEEVDGGTDVRYSFDLTMFGRLGSLGEPIVRGAAKKIADKFAANLQGVPLR